MTDQIITQIELLNQICSEEGSDLLASSPHHLVEDALFVWANHKELVPAVNTLLSTAEIEGINPPVNVDNLAGHTEEVEIDGLSYGVCKELAHLVDLGEAIQRKIDSAVTMAKLGL